MLKALKCIILNNTYKLSIIQEIISTSAAETYTLGVELGKLLDPGDLVAFSGDLGAGKTCCIQGIAVGLGVLEPTQVTSPTFTLIHEYKGRIPLYHFDVYRFTREDEIYDLGYEEYFYGNGVTVIEWAERIMAFLPDEYLAVHLHIIRSHQFRRIQLQAYGDHYAQIAHALHKQWEG